MLSLLSFVGLSVAVAGVVLPLFGSLDLSAGTWADAGRALSGSLRMVGVALVVAVPVGVLVGICAAEIGGRMGRLARVAAELVAALPGIVLGVAAYSVVVLGLGGGALSAGSAALGCIIAPSVARAVRELLEAAPANLREVALSLGVSRYRVVLFVLLRTAAPGLFGAVLWAAARAIGEAAPIVFFTTVASSWGGPDETGLASLPTEVFALGSAPGAAGYGRANVMALILTAVVGALAVLGRLGGRRSA